MPLGFWLASGQHQCLNCFVSANVQECRHLGGKQHLSSSFEKVSGVHRVDLRTLENLGNLPTRPQLSKRFTYGLKSSILSTALEHVL